MRKRLVSGLTQTILRKPPSQPRSFPRSGFLQLPKETAIEEEALPYYNANRYFPVDIGAVYQSRYQVVGKLGYGATSTVWLARDLQEHKYVVLKFYIAEEATQIENNNELKIARRLSLLRSKSRGVDFVRQPTDHFELGRSPCIVFEPLGMSLEDLQHLIGPMPQDLVRSSLYYITLALGFLHSDADVIHTDIKASNILMKVEDQSTLQAVEDAELEDPCPRKSYDDRAIYCSRSLPTPSEGKWGDPVLTDFGEARIGRQMFQTHIQPVVYRSPEIFLEMPWDNKVDIWNLGLLAWDLLEGRHLFDGHDSDNEHSRERHLAEMVALLGPPPREFLQRSPIWQQFFMDDGSWISKEVAIPNVTLESSETILKGYEKKIFLNMIRSMLQWDPAKRPSAEELRTEDTWMRIR